MNKTIASAVTNYEEFECVPFENVLREAQVDANDDEQVITLTSGTVIFAGGKWMKILKDTTVLLSERGIQHNNHRRFDLRNQWLYPVHGGYVDVIRDYETENAKLPYYLNQLHRSID